MSFPVVLLIPAYQPGPELLDVVRATAGSGVAATVVVDDGSGPGYRAIFEAVQQVPGVHLLRHAVNLGKGAALKTGMNFALVEYPEMTAVVTADADGQHHPDDIARVLRRFDAQRGALVLGVRGFSGDVPLRSRIGNALTRMVMRLVVGHRLTDTQTGLRAIPRALAERMLVVAASGYEFELEMLLVVKHLGIGIDEEPIRTIYQEGNRTSHFQPFRDSTRIYFVLLRFGFLSIATAALDNVAFFALFHATGGMTGSLFIARLLAVAFNYSVVRKAVFFSSAQHKKALPRFLLLAGANLCVSYGLISFLTELLSIPVMLAKVGVEACLFIANFALLRDFVFTRPAENGGPG